jgi:hypothetical protein
MTLKEFAELSGVILSRCSEDWGGTWEYGQVDHPTFSVAGYKTEEAAYRGWAENTFGETAANALLKLLTPTGANTDA